MRSKYLGTGPVGKTEGTLLSPKSVVKSLTPCIFNELYKGLAYLLSPNCRLLR